MGHGGVEYIAGVLGCDPKTIRQGQAELEEADDLDTGRVRKKGVDGKRLIEYLPGPRSELLEGARGPHRRRSDAGRGEVDELVAAADRAGGSRELGTPVSRQVVSQLLRKHGYRRRKALKKKTMGPRNPNRNAQFENIARLKKKYLKAGLPVISMDTKKKELLGNFYRDGTIDTQETIETNDHDFGSAGVGDGDPPRSLRCGEEQGFVHLNTSHDTSELACDSIAAWWDQQGRADYPQAKKLLVLCDGGRQQQRDHVLVQGRSPEAGEPAGHRDPRGPLPALLLEVQSD